MYAGPGCRGEGRSGEPLAWCWERRLPWGSCISSSDVGVVWGYNESFACGASPHFRPVLVSTGCTSRDMGILRGWLAPSGQSRKACGDRGARGWWCLKKQEAKNQEQEKVGACVLPLKGSLGGPGTCTADTSPARPWADTDLRVAGTSAKVGVSLKGGKPGKLLRQTHRLRLLSPFLKRVFLV